MNNKQLVILTVALLLGTPSLFAEEVAQEQSGQAVVTKAPAKKGPWSGSLSVNVERTSTDKPLKGTSATTAVKIGRKLTDLVSLAFSWPFENKFVANTAKTGVQQYVTLKDPSLSLSRSDLFDLSGVKGKGSLGVSLPVVDTLLVDALQRATEKNPHRGIYNYRLSAEKAIDHWTLSVTHGLTWFNYENAVNLKEKLNNRYALSNTLGVSYKLTDAVSLASSVESSRLEKRRSMETEYSLGWENSVSVEPLAGLSLSAALKISAPNESIRKAFSSDENRLKNTSFGFSASYSFL